MKKRIYCLILVGILGIVTVGNAAISDDTLLVAQIDLPVSQDTIQPRITTTPTRKIKRPKKNWLPKIRLRVLVVLFREKLKERDRRKRKPVYPIVANEKKQLISTQTK